MKGFYVQGCVMICRVIRSKHISMKVVHPPACVHLNALFKTKSWMGCCHGLPGSARDRLGSNLPPPPPHTHLLSCSIKTESTKDKIWNALLTCRSFYKTPQSKVEPHAASIIWLIKQSFHVNANKSTCCQISKSAGFIDHPLNLFIL